MHSTVYQNLLDSQLKTEDFERVPCFPHVRTVQQLMGIMATFNVPRDFTNKLLKFVLEHEAACLFYIHPKIRRKGVKAGPITVHHSYMLSALSRLLAKILNQKCDELPGIAKDSRQAIGEMENVRLPFD